ncbi:MAG: proline dehydrogenase family protein [Bacteroidetes bacterium]|nr:proline dehydrogenase family protein [Bacteroidota bacterium]
MLNQIISATLPFVPKYIVGKVSSRYIAGTSLDDSIKVSQNLNNSGSLVTLDLLGEDITSEAEAIENKNEYEKVLTSIAHNRLNANLSLKLTQLGLKINYKFCVKNLTSIIKLATRYNNFVRIDMEDHTCTDETLEMYSELYKNYKNVGVVIQAYLKRSENDIKLLSKNKANIRLCKGIYKEPDSIAFQDAEEVRENYKLLLKKIFENKSYIGIATHDDNLINDALNYISTKKKNISEYEFQMLLGVRAEKRKSIISDGHPLRVYTPYGKDWYAYSIRRLKENPQMAFYIAKAFFGLEK